MLDGEAVRYRQKIESVLTNAKAIVKIQRSRGSFDAYLWAPGADSNDEDALKSMSKQLQRGGFTFVGAMICHSFRQATSMVNDHETNCCRRRDIERLSLKRAPRK